MRGEPTDFWAKLKYDDNESIIEWHPLVDHCIDVGLVFRQICTDTTIKQALARISGKPNLTEVQIERLSFIAALHDFGKLNIGFQNRSRKKAEFYAGHVKEALGLIYNAGPFENEFLEALNFNEIITWSSENQVCYYLIASVMHHGKTYRVDACEGYAKSIYWSPAGGKKPFAGLAHIINACFKTFTNTTSCSAEDLLPVSTNFEYIFSGIVCLADWIASDTRFFPFACEKENRANKIQSIIQTALEQIGVVTLRSKEFLRNHDYHLPEIFGFPLYELQHKVAELPIPAQGSITILESATGSGKTEACIARFLNIMKAGAVDGMYFALPTRTAATQIFERMSQYIKKAFPDESNRPPVILAVPGYLKYDDREGKKLPGFEVLWSDEDYKNEIAKKRGWAAENPKRYLAGAILVGTIDQILLSQLAAKHSLLRASAMLRLFLVVDEVHASDEYMNRILKFVLQTHTASAGHSLLMSATLSCEMAEQYLAIAGKQYEMPTLEIAMKKGFPFIECQGVSEQLIQTSSLLPGNSKTVEWRTAHLDNDKIAEIAIEKANLGGRIIIIKNTVKDCIKVQESLENLAERKRSAACLFKCSEVAAPHHSRYVPEDRIKLDQTLEKSFGKSSQPQGCIVCATQTVQQSLDIDADFMITDLSPMDVLLQRIGRLHRHLRDDRSPNFLVPQCIICLPEKPLSEIARTFAAARDENYVRTEMGLGLIYENLAILEATQKQIDGREKITIPDANRELIEKTMHSQVLEEICSQSEDFRSQIKLVRGKSLSRSTSAALNRFDWSAIPGENCSGDANDEKIMTRLGEGDLCITLPEECISAFGNRFNQISIPAFMAKGISMDTDINVIDKTNGNLIFALGATTFIYDRKGLRKHS